MRYPTVSIGQFPKTQAGPSQAEAQAAADEGQSPFVVRLLVALFVGAVFGIIKGLLLVAVR